MNRRLRVLFAIGSLEAGGSERQLIGFLRHLDRSRFEPHLYLLNRVGEFLNEVPDDVSVTAFSDQPRTSGMFDRLKLPGRIHRQQVRHLSATLMSGSFDVLYERTARMSLVAAPAVRHARVPRVSAIVADPEYDLRENFPRFRFLKQRLIARAYRTADLVIANSESLRLATAAFFQLPGKKTATVWNGFDFELLRRMSEEQPPIELCDRVLSPDCFLLIAVGRLCSVKGFDDLIEAVRILVRERGTSALRLWLVGSGPDEERLRQQVREARLDEHVWLAGFVRNPFPLLKRADLFCLTSHFEGMPNVLVEAIACEVPVLATDCAHGPREILDGGQFGELVAPGNAISIADGIERCLTNRTANRGRAASALERAKSRFTIESSVRALEGHLLSVSRKNPDSSEPSGGNG